MIDQRVIETVESLIHNTSNRIKDVQSNLIPFYNKGLIKHVDAYRMYNVPYMAETDHQSVFLVGDLKYKDLETPQAYRGVYKVRMRDAFLHELIHPFLLFVNGKFVKWSNIQIVRDVNYSYIVADEVYYPEVKTVDIIEIPFNVYYDENGYIEPDTEIMFTFDDNGVLSDIGNTVISFNKNDVSDIHMDSFDAPLGNVIGWDVLNVENKVKLFPENFILFKDGLLYHTEDIIVDPMNVISIDKGQSEGRIEGRIFYDEYSNFPKNNVYQFHGDEQISNLMKQAQQNEENVPYYVKKLREDFNFEFNNTKSYDENIVDSIKYIYQYNPQLLYPAHTSPIVIRSWTGKEVNELLTEDGSLVMTRDKYDNHQTYIIPFLNGELYKHHDQTVYHLSTFELSVPEKLQDDDLLEIIYFKNIDNATILGHVTKEDPMVSLDGYINKEDLLVYADSHHNMEYPTIGFNSRLAYRIDYNWDEETKAMSFDDDYYYGRDLAFVSKNKFVYAGYNLRQKCFKFQLSDEFKYCDNQKQFLVFINGRKLSYNEFNITILKNTRPFDDLYIYTSKILEPGDKLDVFYVPYAIEGVHLYNTTDTETNSIETVQGIFTYDIPVPSDSYLLNDGKLEVYGDGVLIEPDLYIVDTETRSITLNQAELPEKLTFVTYEVTHNVQFDESGYIYIDKSKLPAPFCKELYMIFVNGKKVANDHIYNISPNCVRITTDIQSTYNVSVMLYRDAITDLLSLLHITSSIEDLVESVEENELDRLNNVFNIITNSEDKFVVDVEKIAIINEIVRDFWMRPGINEGLPFLYDYDTDAFIKQDSAGNWIIPAMDATEFINILEETEQVVIDLDLPNPTTDPYYDKTVLNEN